MDQGPRYLKPGWLTSRVLNPLLMRLDVVSTLAVRGRVSGEWRTVPVNVLELEGQRYLVAARGDTEWVRNLRVTGRGEVRRLTRVEAFRACGAARQREAAHHRSLLGPLGLPGQALFRGAAEAADHQVFRIERL
jgi:F420H(2)-dependent quinone reductase